MYLKPLIIVATFLIMVLTFGKEAQFRFYEELNDFLPLQKKKKSFSYQFNGKPSIKDAVEAIGIPHTEVDLILANGRSVGFDYHLLNSDFVSVYPVFESFDISPIVRLREEPLRRSSFVLDVHLGKLARLLRMLGFNALYRNNYDDPEIVSTSLKQKRIILTRDRHLLHVKQITHGYWIRSQNPENQLLEVLGRFDLYGQIKSFHRCIVCNGIIKEINKQEIIERLEPKTARYYNEFYLCDNCKKIYWKGSHYKRMKSTIDKFLQLKET